MDTSSDMSSDERSAFYYATNGYLIKLANLLSNGLNPRVVNCNNQTLLHIACSVGNVKMVEMLLKFDVDVNARDKLGITALWEAVGKPNAKIVKALLERGADPNVENKTKYPAIHAIICAYSNCHYGTDELPPLLDDLDVDCLHRAAKYAKSSEIRRLICEGADPDVLDSEGRSAIEIAMSSESHVIGDTLERKETLAATCVRTLLEHGANVDTITKDGWHILCLAAKNNKYRFVANILRYSPEKVASPEGKYPIDYAIANKNEQMDIILTNRSMI